MHKQLLPFWDSLDGDFLVSPSNIDAYNLVLNPSKWPQHTLIVYGSWGKSHLIQLLIAKGYKLSHPEEINGDSKIIWDNFPGAINCEIIFHRWNQIATEGRSLCVTMRNPPQVSNITPIDLKSRMSAALSVRVKPPEYELRRKIFTQWLRNNDINLEENVLEYFFTHHDDELPRLEQKAQLIHNYALLHQKTATIYCIKESLETEKR